MKNYRESLKKAVLHQLGGGQEALNSIDDVANNGAGSGHPGFTYYTDTVNFYHKNKKAINQLAEEVAQDLGCDLLSMIKNFKCLNDDFSEAAIAKVVFGKIGSDDASTLIANAMSWFVLEEVANDIVANLEEVDA
jgi:hypothetical protein